MNKYSKIVDYSNECLCSTHRYQEKTKCNIENCNKFVSKYKKYCKKHNIPNYKNYFHYNSYNRSYHILEINMRILYKNTWKKKYYYTSSTPILYGFGYNTLDLEENISLYILENEKYKKRKSKWKIKYMFLFIYSKIKKKQIKMIQKEKKFDKKVSNFLYFDKSKIEFYLTTICYILKTEKSIGLVKSFILNILNIISNDIGLRIDNYITKKDEKSVVLFKYPLHKNNYIFNNNIYRYIWWYKYNIVYDYWKKWKIYILLKNEITIYIKNNYKSITMNIEKEDIKNELCNISPFLGKTGIELQLLKEFYGNSKCNFDNEIKKMNILKNKLLKHFKEYNLKMGTFKRSLIALMKDIGETQYNKEYCIKDKYVECRITEIAFHDHVFEDIEYIISHIKMVNIEIINKINIVSFTSNLLSIIAYFKKDYIFFINNYIE
jgi:hypothetical protein